MSDIEEPVMKQPVGWETRVPQGWEWATLWEAVDEGDHKFAD